MTSCFEMLGMVALPDGNFTSHSYRIGAHIETGLLGIPLEARLARFSWGPDSASMAALYFDRMIHLSAESYWFLGAPRGGRGAPNRCRNIAGYVGENYAV